MNDTLFQRRELVSLRTTKKVENAYNSYDDR
jgi:hypothetical protein